MRILEVVAVFGLLGAATSATTLHITARTRVAVRRAIRRPRTWLIAVPTAIAVFALGLPFLYTRIVLGPPPKPLTFADLPVTEPEHLRRAANTDIARAPKPKPMTPAAARPIEGEALSEMARSSGPLDGQWTIAAGSQAGYSIDDTVMGQTSRVVGRTTKITGGASVVETSGMTAKAVVDMTTVSCDCVHDSKYQDLLDVEQFPTSTFVLTSPITVSKLPPRGTVEKIAVRGKFTIHGVTRPVSFVLHAKQHGNGIAVNGSIPVRLEDYDVERPDAGPFGKIDNAAIDLLLAFER